MFINNIYDKGLIVSKKAEFGLESFIKGTNIIKEICNPNSLILVIDDKSIQSTLALVSSVRAKINLILLDITNFERQYKEIFHKFNPDIILSSENVFYKLGFDNLIKTDLFNLFIINKSKNKSLQDSQYFPLVLLGTSGTSGPQKFVGLTHHNLKVNCNSIKKYLLTNKNTKCINNLPCSYSYGLSVLNTTLSAGGKYFISEEPSILRKSFWEDMNYFRVTDFSGVPSVYQDLQKLNLIESMSHSIQCLTQAGGKLSINNQKYLLNWCKNKNIKLFIMYGQTEASARLTFLNLTSEPHKIGSVGRVIPDIKLINDDIHKEKEFELIFQGENISLGYFQNRDQLDNPVDINNGILKTGDIGFIDDDDCIFITGRISRFAKIDGKRLSLDQIENSLKEIYADLAVVSNDQILFILFNQEGAFNIKDFKKQVKILTGLHYSKIKITYGVVPRSSNGKIKYQKIIKEYLS